MHIPNLPMLIGFCNPLLDISAHVSDELLEKYHLKPNNAILALPEHSNLVQDMVKDSSSPVLYSAGGAGQNAMRAAQWLLPPRSVAFMGAVGKDEYATILRDAAINDGLQVVYQETESRATGTCACLLTPGHRSLVASLGACELFSSAHLEHHVDLMKGAKFFYVSLFLLSSASSVPRFISNLTRTRPDLHQVSVNLAAPFICEAHVGILREIVDVASLLFGNESEARALNKAAGLLSPDASILEIVGALSTWARPANAPPRTVCITQGPDPTMCFDPAAGAVRSFPVPQLRPQDIVDTTGAGDAFCGAFLSQWVQGRPLEKCVEAGHCVAQIVIRQSGVVFPNNERPQF